MKFKVFKKRMTRFRKANRTPLTTEKQLKEWLRARTLVREIYAKSND